jgi:integrase
MSQELTDAIVKALEAPEKGNKVYYDARLPGFGCRVTAAGERAFVLNFRTRSGRERRFTIGRADRAHGWSVAAARKEASALKDKIRAGYDPLAELQAEREAPTMARLCERYEEEHLPKKRRSSQRDDRGMIAKEILPTMKHLKVTEVTFSDIDGLHRKISKRGRPHRANRTIALLSKMFNLAIKWRWRSDNPAKGIERNPEIKRERYLVADELPRLTKALAGHEDQQAANILRLLLLTGARSGEVRSATWDQFDLKNGVWTKPSAATKQKTLHRVPLSAPARQLLAGLRAASKPENEAEYVFPGRLGSYRQNIKDSWAEITKAAKISGVRIHDLRHTYASLLASAGLSLPVIGALLLDDPLRRATERVGALVAPTGRNRPKAVIPMVRR